MLLAYLLPTGLAVITIGWLTHRAAANAMEQELGRSLESIARIAADLMAKPRALDLGPGDENSRTHKNLQQKLRGLKQATRVERIYLFGLDERALVDSGADSSIGEPIAALAANRAELDAVRRGGSRSSVLFSAADGTWYKTGFAPVMLDGRVAAAVGVDGSATFFDPLETLGRTLALAGALALALAVLLTLLVSRRITRPLDRLARAAQDIGAGELEREIEVETADEIGMLASTLNEMRRSIQARDRQLQLMLSGIAHEVRNPLGGMTLFVGLLQEELAADDPARKHAERIAGELDYLSRVVTDFLDFARKKAPTRNLVDPRLELEHLDQLCARKLSESGVTLTWRVDDALKSVYWDPERMRGALLNLVRNAIQASASGDRIDLQLGLADPERLVITIADQGTGIPEEKRAQVFEPFFTTRQKGTGLGLALAKKIIESHGGSITFTSAAAGGTTFRIELPHSEGTQQEDA